jgi:DNA (cytosine-5)-methyltransferase 1
MLRVLDLFSGVGAYSLGLERTGGFRTVAFCEIEEYPRKILRKHWPDVPIFEDVRALNATVLRDAGIVPQWIVAGWPCQDISLAGTGSGLDGARSGLWGEIARLASELDLDGLLLENSSNLLAINGGADFGRVLGNLAALGFDAEWHCLPAAAFDAPHIRDRLWIVAHRRGTLGGRPSVVAPANTDQQRLQGQSRHGDVGDQPGRINSQAAGYVAEGGVRGNVADASLDGRRQGRQGRTAPHGEGRRDTPRPAVADADCFAPIGTAIARQERHSWQPEPGLGRVATGIANRVDRLRAIGNLNPPIIPETIGRAILEARAAA